MNGMKKITNCIVSITLIFSLLVLCAGVILWKLDVSAMEQEVPETKVVLVQNAPTPQPEDSKTPADSEKITIRLPEEDIFSWYNDLDFSRPVQPSGVCVPAGGLEYNGHYYLIYTGTAETWDDAKAFCENRGGYLAVIADQEENDALYGYLLSAEITTAYFGLYETEEGVWNWVENEQSDYFNWAPGEPSNSNGTERYGEYYYKFTDGTWNDGDYNYTTVMDTISFICEWDAYQIVDDSIC